MKKEFHFWIYIMASDSGTIYIGVTNNLEGRVEQHKKGEIEGFTQKYHCHKLVYFEEHQYINNAIERENQLKKWNRKKKEALIRSLNPTWFDLAHDWY